MNQSIEERANFKLKFNFLYKIKRTICEICNFDDIQVAVNKTDKKIFFVERTECRLACTILSSGVIQCESCVDKQIVDRFNVKSASHKKRVPLASA